MSRSAAILFGFMLLAGVAQALPPDERVVVAPDSVKFLKPDFVLQGVTVEPEGFAKAEILPAHELLVTIPPNAKGVGTVLAFGSNRVHAWEFCVGSCPAETTIDSAKSACPTLTRNTEEGHAVWAVTVNTTACLNALRAALLHATVQRSDLRVTYSEAVATDFFRQVLNVIAADPKTNGIKVGYYGPTLKVSGETTTAALGRVLVHAYLKTAGTVTYDDDDLTLTDAPGATETPK